MDDKQRAQGLKAIQKAAVATDAAEMELKDILTNGCGCPETVETVIASVQEARAALDEAHIGIRTAHIVKAAKEQGAPLPFKEGEEGTRAPRGGKGKGKGKPTGKDAAAGPDAD